MNGRKNTQMLGLLKCKKKNGLSNSNSSVCEIVIDLKAKIMELSKIMETTPETLARVQYDALQKHVISILQLALINVSNHKGVGDTPTFYSPAGDGMGMDNTCIDFAYKSGTDGLDFADVCSELMRLRAVAKGD